MVEALCGVVGFLLGVCVAWIVASKLHGNKADSIVEIADRLKRSRDEEMASIIEQARTSFSALSREALSANADDFLKLANERLAQETAAGGEQLESKRKLIDAKLEETNKKLLSLSEGLQSIEKERRESHGSLTGTLEKQTQATNRLHETTSQLRAALANPQRRGQWGERMADDVLRLAGFVEGINYAKQESQADGGRPDFTFFLPGDQCINMDVKFPLASYLKALDATSDLERDSSTKQFLRDVRMRIKEVTTRSYIDPAAGTMDYVLVFIPNEQVYSFIHEHDGALLDEAIRQKVVLCSPLTLYAVLAVVRQSVESFHLERASAKILELLGSFSKEWNKYVERMDVIGRRLADATKAYDDVRTTRTRQLERKLDEIDNLREEAGRSLSDGSTHEKPTPN